MRGKGNLVLTGQLGDVMQESARAALSYVRTRAELYGAEPDFYEKKDIHVHIPEGAIPKDGPSAGITMATSILSAVTRIPVRKDIAMTGEITLRGKVLPVGGIKEKLLAAYRAGITTIVLPKENDKDLDDLPEEIRASWSSTSSRTWTRSCGSRSRARPRRWCRRTWPPKRAPRRRSDLISSTGGQVPAPLTF